jgi:hypothetical protein
MYSDHREKLFLEVSTFVALDENKQKSLTTRTKALPIKFVI